MKIKPLFINIFIFTLLCLIFINKDLVILSVQEGVDVWKANIFPCLFPFFIISHLMISYGFISLLRELLKPIFYILKMNPNISFIFVMSLLSGSPSNAKYTSSLYQKKLLTKQEAEKALAFTYFSNPLFILGTVATSFLKNKNIGLTILISHILAEIILIFLFYHDQNQKYEKINLKKALNEMKQLGYQNSFSSSMIESITDSLKTCTLILGTIVFIYILTSSFSSFMPNNIYLSSTIKGILEVTQGLKAVSLLNIPLIYKATLSTFLLSFGGISIYIQIISILKDTDLNANYYIIIRCLHAAFSSLICYTILSI